MLHGVTVSKQGRAMKIERHRQERFPVSPDEQVLACKHTTRKSNRPVIIFKAHLGHKIGSCPEKDDEKE